MPSPDRDAEPVALHIERLDGPEPDGDADVLGADPRPARRRWVVVASVVAVLLLGAVVVDRSQREREVDALIVDVETAAAAVALADTRAMMVQVYVRPVSASGQPGSTLSADVDAIVRDAEVVGADELAGEGRRLDTATVLPWHGDVAGARDVLRRFVEGEERRLRRDDDDTTPTIQDVADAARAVVPEGPQGDRLEAVLDGIPRVRD
jgi:hypothetical protein